MPNQPGPRNLPDVPDFPRLFTDNPRAGQKLKNFCQALVLYVQGIPGGFRGTTPPTIQAGVAGAAGSADAGWLPANAIIPILTGVPPNATGPVALEGTGAALMRASATVRQGIVTTKGDLLGHDGTVPVRLPGPTIDRGYILVAPAAPVDVTIWRAPWPCTVTAVKAWRTGGVSASVNARRNGVDEHLAADLVTTGGVWDDGGAVQNTAYVAGDSLEVRLKAVAGAPPEVVVQVELSRP